jgi:hypothetical protein
MARWTETFDQSYRPTILDIRKYLSPQTAALLEELNQHLYRAYRIKATPAYYTKRNGWTTPYRLRGVTLFSLVILDETTFIADQTTIRHENELQMALAEIDKHCHDGFIEKVRAMEAARKDRVKKRHSLDNYIAERKQHLCPHASDPEKLNKFRWVPALSPMKLRQLYASSANGMLDHELLDDVGILFYIRCQQGTEEYTLLRTDKLKCHHCGLILHKQEGLMVCKCGWQYTFQEYIFSFNEHRMPGGNAFHIFTEYVEKWPQAHNDSEKMILIDWLIHQCHISMSSGLGLRSILKNLIDAPQKTAEKLILELAYGNISSVT